MKSNIFWFRRDLRLEDNTALIKALNSSNSIIPFLFLILVL
jgi:deoxyribodipyrimidine photo-lyase